MTAHPLYVAILAFVLACFESCHVQPAAAQAADSAPVVAAWTADEVAAAALTVSECSLVTDCGDVYPITWILAHNAARRGMTIEAYVALVHHRHTRSRTRPWIGGLNAEGTEPAGWPSSVSWPERGAPAWFARLAAVRRALASNTHGCDGTPSIWGGPQVDRDRIHRMEALGYRRLRCPGARNVFMARGGR